MNCCLEPACQPLCVIWRDKAAQTCVVFSKSRKKCNHQDHGMKKMPYWGFAFPSNSGSGKPTDKGAAGCFAYGFWTDGKGHSRAFWWHDFWQYYPRSCLTSLHLSVQAWQKDIQIKLHWCGQDQFSHVLYLIRGMHREQRGWDGGEVMGGLGMWGPVVTAGNAQSRAQTSVENGLCFTNKMAVVSLVRGSLEFRWSPSPVPTACHSVILLKMVLLCLFMWCVYISHAAQVEVRGQITGLHSFFPLRGSQEFSSPGLSMSNPTSSGTSPAPYSSFWFNIC